MVVHPLEFFVDTLTGGGSIVSKPLRTMMRSQCVTQTFLVGLSANRRR
jgi:hypothetical protein